MGVFDTYGETQLKAGEPWQNVYKPGDPVLIPDGVYIDFDEPNCKAVVVSAGLFFGEFNVFDCFGESRQEKKSSDG
jgi:hypothetical protein